MSSCNTGCATSSTAPVTLASGGLIQQYNGTPFSSSFNTLLCAMDKAEIRMRTCRSEYDWSPSNFNTKKIPYGQKPVHNEVIFEHNPLYFNSNQGYFQPIEMASAGGGLCGEVDLCSEIPANPIPGDAYSTLHGVMGEVAFETPVFCLKNLLHKENGVDYINRFCSRLESIPFEYYDNFIRNRIWENGEKYFMANTDCGILWNSSARLDQRLAPNLLEFKAYADTPLASPGIPTLAGLQKLEYYIEQYMGNNCSTMSMNGQKRFMMVGDKNDLFNIFYNDTDCGVCSWVEAGMGFDAFTFAILDKLPYAIKYAKNWFRGDYNDQGEFEQIPAMVYVPQNGGKVLRLNNKWLSAPWRVLTWMTMNPFTYLEHGPVPNFGSCVPEEAKRMLSPRFGFYPLQTKCRNMGEVAWRTDETFGLMDTGEKIMHLIFPADSDAACMRGPKKGNCIIDTECDDTVDIPNNCGGCSYGKCCCVAGPEGYIDSAYSVEVTSGDPCLKLGVAPGGAPVPVVIHTTYQDFTGVILGVTSDKSKITFAVDPAEHPGGHKCCESQFRGFSLPGEAKADCEAGFPNGLCPTADPAVFAGQLTRDICAAEGDTVSLFIDGGCGQVTICEAEVTKLKGCSIEVKLDLEKFPGGVPCEAFSKVCASDNPCCADCLPSTEAADCVPFEGPKDCKDGEEAPVEPRAEGEALAAPKVKQTRAAARVKAEEAKAKEAKAEQAKKPSK